MNILSQKKEYLLCFFLQTTTKAISNYSSVPNKRSYLNNHTYQNFDQKLSNVPTQISKPIGNLPNIENHLNYQSVIVNRNSIVGIIL